MQGGSVADGDSFGIDAKTAWQSLTSMAETYPDAKLSFINTNGEPQADLPQMVSDLFGCEPKSYALFQTLDSRGLSNITKTWNRARIMGGAQCHVDTDDTRLRVVAVNLTSQCGGFVLVVMPAPDHEADTDPDQDPDSGEGHRGRVMVHHLDETAALCSFDENTRRYLGWTDEDLGSGSLPKIHPADQERAIGLWIEMLAHPGSLHHSRHRYQHGNGSWRWVEVTIHNLLDAEGIVRRELVDITDEIDALSTARQRDLLLNRLAEALPSGIAEFLPDGTLAFHNARWTELTGQTTDDQSDFTQVMVEPEPQELRQSIIDAMTNGTDFDREVTLLSPATGSRHRCSISARPVEDDDGNIDSILFCLNDITESWKLQRRLAEQASTDPLTGLANRSAIVSSIDDALTRASGTDTTTAVLFFDLNGFKRVNDKYGHGVGDELLRRIAASFRNALRDGDVAGRQGGDEFIVVCTDVDSPAAAMHIARRLLDTATGRWRIEGHLLETRASCGLAICQGSNSTAEKLIAEADLAMYEQKRTKKPEPGVFRPEMFVEQRLELDRDDALRIATTDGSLRLHYQPFIDLATGNTVGYEALLRWQFGGALTPPHEFIGLAERRGFINEIGAWVIDQVCAEAKRPHHSPDTFFTLNVSPIQLRATNFSTIVEAALQRNSLSPKSIGLELTEGLMIADTPETNRTIHMLHELGVPLIVDDFGTGFASLEYLRTLPVGGIKIDRGFVNELDRPRTESIVRTMINLSKQLDLWLVAEGIETEAQQHHLRRLGATVGQGYYFARPAPIDQFTDASLQSG